MTNVDLASLARQSSPAERRANLGATGANAPGSEVTASRWRRVVAVMRAVDDSWIGDAIGTALIFATGYGLILVALVLS